MEIIKDIDKLRIKSENCIDINEIKNTINILQNQLEKMDNAVGLAAVQVGINKKICVMKYNKLGEKYISLINPEIISLEDPFIYYQEGCLSFPNKYINTNRYRSVIIKNNILEDDKLKEETQYFYYNNDEEIDKLMCIAVQHELDHFEGKLFYDVEYKNVPVINTDIKVGRNDKCPCGSNKKYKKCCGA